MSVIQSSVTIEAGKLFFDSMTPRGDKNPNNGVERYCWLIGIILSLFGYAQYLPTKNDNSYYVSKADLTDWVKRHGLTPDQEKFPDQINQILTLYTKSHGFDHAGSRKEHVDNLCTQANEKPKKAKTFLKEASKADLTNSSKTKLALQYLYEGKVAKGIALLDNDQETQDKLKSALDEKPSPYVSLAYIFCLMPRVQSFDTNMDEILHSVLINEELNNEGLELATLCKAISALDKNKIADVNSLISTTRFKSFHNAARILSVEVMRRTSEYNGNPQEDTQVEVPNIFNLPGRQYSIATTFKDLISLENNHNVTYPSWTTNDINLYGDCARKFAEKGRLHSGTKAEILEFFKDALVLEPNSWHALTYRAEYYLTLGDFANARKDAEAASKIPGSNLCINSTILAWCALLENNLDQAKKYASSLNDLTLLEKTYPLAHIFLAVMAAQSGNQGNMIQKLLQASLIYSGGSLSKKFLTMVDDEKSFAPIWRLACENNSKLPDRQDLKALPLFWEGELNDVNVNIGNSLSDPAKPYALHLQGVTFCEQNELQAAEECLEKLKPLKQSAFTRSLEIRIAALKSDEELGKLLAKQAKSLIQSYVPVLHCHEAHVKKYILALIKYDGFASPSTLELATIFLKATSDPYGLFQSWLKEYSELHNRINILFAKWALDNNLLLAETTLSNISDNKLELHLAKEKLILNLTLAQKFEVDISDLLQEAIKTHPKELALYEMKAKIIEKLTVPKVGFDYPTLISELEAHLTKENMFIARIKLLNFISDNNLEGILQLMNKDKNLFNRLVNDMNTENPWDSLTALRLYLLLEKSRNVKTLSSRILASMLNEEKSHARYSLALAGKWFLDIGQQQHKKGQFKQAKTNLNKAVECFNESTAKNAELDVSTWLATANSLLTP